MTPTQPTIAPVAAGRTDYLMAAAAVLAGAAAGVLVQAAGELARTRRAQRGQLRDAARLLDERDEQLHELRRQLDTANAAVDQQLELRTREGAEHQRTVRYADELQRDWRLAVGILRALHSDDPQPIEEQAGDDWPQLAELLRVYPDSRAAAQDRRDDDQAEPDA